MDLKKRRFSRRFFLAGPVPRRGRNATPGLLRRARII
jgi:hypothetical protein